MKIHNLKPRLAAMDTFRAQPIAQTERLRGRAGMERRAKWLAAHPLCVDCVAEGSTRAADEVDHDIPLWQGGADDESNFASRCKTHHAVKTAAEAALRVGRP